jgi:hypothetical protein
MRELPNTEESVRRLKRSPGMAATGADSGRTGQERPSWRASVGASLVRKSCVDHTQARDGSGAKSWRRCGRHRGLAPSRHGNSGSQGRRRNVSVSGSTCLVGTRRSCSGAAIHARGRRKNVSVLVAIASDGRRSSAGYVQRGIIRLAAAEDTMSQSANHSITAGCSAPGRFSCGAKSVAVAAGVRQVVAPRASCAELRAPRPTQFLELNSSLFAGEMRRG